MIWKESFEHFSQEFCNKDLVDRGVYGILVIDWDANTWTPTEVIEEDFPKYSHIAKYKTEEQKEIMVEKAFVLNSGEYRMWPLVRKVDW